MHDETKHIKLAMFAFKTRIGKQRLYKEFGYKYDRSTKGYIQERLPEEKTLDYFVCLIVIGNPLMLSPDFPPLHTVHATFTAHGVPSLVILTIYYNLPCSFLGVVFPEFLLNLLSGAERSAFPFASY